MLTTNGSHAVPRVIYINMDNCVYQLDDTLYTMYCEKFGKGLLPSPSEMINKKNYLPRSEQYKLLQLLTDESFFSRLQPLDHAKGILLEIYQYEEKYGTIDARLFTSMNPFLHSIYFARRDFQSCDGKMVMDDGSVTDYIATASEEENREPLIHVPYDHLLRIVTSKINWITKLLGTRKNWTKKMVFLEETLTHNTSPMLNSSDIIVQAYPHIGEQNTVQRNQIVMLLRSRCNEEFVKSEKCKSIIALSQHSTRSFFAMKDWKDWKKAWSLEFSLNDFLNKFDSSQTAGEVKNSVDSSTFEVPFFVHGSKDSTDVDKFYMFKDKIPLESDSNYFIRSSGTEDRNLVVVRTDDMQILKSDTDKGYMVDVFKGLVDEANNALFTTYPLHEQKYPCPLAGKVRRLIPLKVCNTLMNLLGKVRRSKPYRDECVKALNVPSFKYKKLVLETIVFNEMVNKFNLDDVKYCAFRLGQTMALVKYGWELYTKSEIAECFTDLRPLLYRDEGMSYDEKLDVIQKYKDWFVKEIKHAVSMRFGHINIIHVDEDQLREEDYNYFYLQCNGFVCDLKDKTQRCLAYGFDHYKMSHKLQNDHWPFPDTVMENAPTTVTKGTTKTLIHVFSPVREKDLASHSYMVSLLNAIKEDEDERNGVPTSYERLNDPKQQLLTKLTSWLDMCSVKMKTDLELPTFCKQVQLFDFSRFFYTFEYDLQKEELIDVVCMRHKLTNLPVEKEILQHHRSLLNH